MSTKEELLVAIANLPEEEVDRKIAEYMEERAKSQGKTVGVYASTLVKETEADRVAKRIAGNEQTRNQLAATIADLLSPLGLTGSDLTAMDAIEITFKGSPEGEVLPCVVEVRVPHVGKKKTTTSGTPQEERRDWDGWFTHLPSVQQGVVTSRIASETKRLIGTKNKAGEVIDDKNSAITNLKSIVYRDATRKQLAAGTIKPGSAGYTNGDVTSCDPSWLEAHQS